MWKGGAISKFFPAICCAVLALVVESLFAEERGREPAAMRMLSPLQSLHYQSLPRSASLISDGQRDFLVDFQTANTALKERDYEIDAEVRELRMHTIFGINENWNLAFTLPIAWRGGGVFDSSIDGWHDFWGMPQGDRNVQKDDSYDVSGRTNAGSFQLDRAQAGLSNIEVSARRGFRAGDVLLAIELSSSLPTIENDLGHDGLESGVGFLATQHYKSWSWHAGLEAIYFSDTTLQSIRFSPWHAESFVSLVYQWQRISFFTQLHYSSKLIENLNGYPSSLLYQDFGLRCRGFELGIREDLVGKGGASDIGLHLGYRFW